MGSGWGLDEKNHFEHLDVSLSVLLLHRLNAGSNTDDKLHISSTSVGRERCTSLRPGSPKLAGRPLPVLGQSSRVFLRTGLVPLPAAPPPPCLASCGGVRRGTQTTLSFSFADPTF